MKIVIDQNNVKELWKLYENYKDDFYKRYFSDVKCPDFEQFVEDEVTKCSNCGDYVTKDEMGVSELALNDNICQYCMQDGYGR